MYVPGNNFLYWKEGDPKRRVSPDCYVVFGVEKHPRQKYIAWKKVRRLPTVVIEVSSRNTRRKDRTIKQPIYQDLLRIPEYFRFDPTGCYVNPRLQGERLVNAHYQSIEMIDGRLFSEQLGHEVVWEGERIHLNDLGRGRFLKKYAELQRRGDAGMVRTGRQADFTAGPMNRPEAAEAELARVRAELEALRNRT